MSNENKSTSAGMNILGLLGIAFVVLKLTGIIDWSWWWVTAHFWGGIAFGLTMLLLVYVYMLVAIGFSSLSIVKRRRERRQ